MSSIPVNKLQNDSWRRSQSKYSWRPELGLEFHAVLSGKFWVSMSTAYLKEIKKEK